jgi:hypothetical protein
VSVLEDAFEPWNGAVFTIGLAGLLCAAEADEGLATGFFRAEAGADAFVGMQCDVAFQFGGEVILFAVTLEETADAESQCS